MAPTATQLTAVTRAVAPLDGSDGVPRSHELPAIERTIAIHLGEETDPA